MYSGEPQDTHYKYRGAEVLVSYRGGSQGKQSLGLLFNYRLVLCVQLQPDHESLLPEFRPPSHHMHRHETEPPVCTGIFSEKWPTCPATQYFKTSINDNTHKDMTEIHSVDFLLGNESSISDSCPPYTPPASQFASELLKTFRQVEKWWSSSQRQKIARFMFHCRVQPSRRGPGEDLQKYTKSCNVCLRDSVSSQLGIRWRTDLPLSFSQKSQSSPKHWLSCLLNSAGLCTECVLLIAGPSSIIWKCL